MTRSDYHIDIDMEQEEVKALRLAMRKERKKLMHKLGIL